MNEVHRNDVESRYELEEGGQVAIAAYRMEDGAVAFTHTVVPPELEGHGVGSRLVRGALDDVRTRGLSFIPYCSFFAAYAQRHPEVRDLLAE